MRLWLAHHPLSVILSEAETAVPGERSSLGGGAESKDLAFAFNSKLETRNSKLYFDRKNRISLPCVSIQNAGMDHIIAIPTKVAELVRQTMKSPGYGHTAHAELATGYGPCRHCLQLFEFGPTVSQPDHRLLFTYDPFHGLDRPLPA